MPPVKPTSSPSPRAKDNWIKAGDYATIAGGANGVAEANNATVGGGSGCSATAVGATAAGGVACAANGQWSSIGGGNTCTAGGQSSTIGGGRDNSSAGEGGAIAGGQNNTASGKWGAIPGGATNTASGLFSLAAGTSATAAHQGSFVWSDSTRATSSTTNDSFVIDVNEGVELVPIAANPGIPPTNRFKIFVVLSGTNAIFRVMSHNAGTGATADIATIPL